MGQAVSRKSLYGAAAAAVALALTATPALAQQYYPQYPQGQYQPDTYQPRIPYQEPYQADPYQDDAYTYPAQYQDDQYYPDQYDPEDDVVVRGTYERVPDSVQRISQRVSTADLDLRYTDDRRILRQRVSDSAKYLCDRLGESRTWSYTPSCRDDAVRSASEQISAVEARATRRPIGWTPPGRYQQPAPVYWSDDGQ